MLTNNTRAQGRPGRRRQPARRQRVRPHHRDDRRRRRPRRADVPLGNPGQVRRSRRSPRSARRSIRPPPRTAGSACRTIAPSTRMGRLWIATDGNSPASTGRADGSGRSRPRARRAAPRSCFFRVPARRRDVRALLHARRRDAVPRRPASGRGRRGRPNGRAGDLRDARRPAGRTSRTACRRGRRSSPSPGRAAARSASDRRLGVPDRLRVGAHQGADELLVTGEDRHHVDRCDASLPDDASALHHGIAGRQRRAEHQRRQRIPVGAGELHG